MNNPQSSCALCMHARACAAARDGFGSRLVPSF